MSALDQKLYFEVSAGLTDGSRKSATKMATQRPQVAAFRLLNSSFLSRGIGVIWRAL
jgi:hypothetical protein